MRKTLDLQTLNRDFESMAATDILKWTFDAFPENRVVFSTSFGAEGMVMIHLMKSQCFNPRIFTIDTGRNFQETYDVWNEAIKRFEVTIESYSPDPTELQQLLAEQGPNLFYDSVENRKQCCHVRKVSPLPRALSGSDVWLTPLRRGQGESRKEIRIIDWNETHAMYKMSPMANWTEEDVWTCIRNNDIPYNKLYDRGFMTIGCAPCTRPVRPGEGTRSGRWWWETDVSKECGLHIEDGVIKRKLNFQI